MRARLHRSPAAEGKKPAEKSKLTSPSDRDCVLAGGINRNAERCSDGLMVVHEMYAYDATYEHPFSCLCMHVSASA